MNSASTVSAELGLRLVVHEETIVPLVASLYYSAEDPYAVRVAFHVGLDEPVEWTFARDLLAEGVEGATGLGDVKIWPSDGPQSDLRGVVLHVQLVSSYGEAHFEALSTDVSDFLHRTYKIVPDGEESGRINIDGELAELLRRAI